MQYKDELQFAGTEQAQNLRVNGPERRNRGPSGERLTANGASLAAVLPSGAPDGGIPVVGYASVSGPGGAGSLELKQQAEQIESECERRGLVLLEVVGEREPTNGGKAPDRPGLAYALERISAREAKGLVVSELSRLTHSAADLGTIIEWLSRSDARLVAAANSLDTDDHEGRLAAELLIEISSWERDRISERTRSGLQAARLSGRLTGRAAVTDDPDLSERITKMRAGGMTLQAIADQLNKEGVPTVRGGTKWRHSSVQAAAGYRRHRRSVQGIWAAREAGLE
jgi:DNA invertase Pin-like site-specific DNA recombinase